MHQKQGQQYNGIHSHMHPQPIDKIRNPLQCCIGLCFANLVVCDMKTRLISSCFPTEVIKPKGVHECQRNAFTASSDCKCDKQRIIGINLYSQTRIMIASALIEDSMKEVHSHHIKKCKEYLTNGLMYLIVEAHQIRDERSISICMPIVRRIVESSIRVYFIVDICEGHLLIVDTFVGGKEEDQGNTDDQAPNYGCFPISRFCHLIIIINTRLSHFKQALTLALCRFQKDGCLFNCKGNQRIQQQMDQGQLPPSKQSFCRFYLRGLCVFSAKECAFAHGVWDLNYEYYKEGDVIQYDYHKSKDDRQKNIIKGPRVYKTLYDYQPEKIFTLEQLNTEKHARYTVRTLMHQQLDEEFMQLLEIKHPDTPFTEEFLVREFTRVGFNKILMAPIKFNSIANYLCDNYPVSRFFRSTKVIPPNPGKQNVLVKRAQREDIIAAYRTAYLKITEEKAEIDEGVFKKALYTMKMPEDVPPINTVLKEAKLSLREFIEEFLGLQKSKILLECTVEDVVAAGEQFLAEQLPQRMVEWSDVFQHLAKTLNNNNGNLLNQARPFLAARNAFLFFPKHELIFSKAAAPFFESLQPSPCACAFQKPYALEELCVASLESAEPLAEGESYDIYNFETLARCAPHILASGVLGVDLEGRLRRGGFVEMVQLNNGRNTFLFDIWFMNELGEFEAFWLAKKVLRNVMVDPAIVKILHDCRHDSIGLHEFLESCIVNVFDTSATETLIGQLDTYAALWKDGHKDGVAAAKAAIAQCNNVRTPGLNEVLGKYEARHGLNRNKEKYHRMWSKGETEFFCRRPIDPDYRDYCIRDVLDLPEVYEKMLSALDAPAERLAYWISSEYSKQGYESLKEGKQEK